MAYEPEIIAKTDHLLVVSRGEFDVEGGRMLFQALLEHAKRTGLRRLLLDNRSLARPLAATEKALLGLSLEQPYADYLRSGGSPLRAAFLVPENFFMPFRPLADYLNEMGLETETFSDPDSLCEWLGVEVDAG